MNVLRKFTNKNLKLNIKRTIVTIIGIMLSTSLICAVAGMVTSTQKTLENFMRDTNGNYHARFEEVSKENLKYIENNVNVESYFLTNSIGYANLEESKNVDKPYLYISEYNEKALKNSALDLLEGRLPQNNNELVISNTIINNGRVNLKVGDTITLNVGERTLNDGSKLNQFNPYLEGTVDKETGKTLSEKIINTNKKTYTIVGIIDRLSYNQEGYNAPGYTAISYMENENNIEKANISVLYKTPSNYEEVTKDITKQINYNGEPDINKDLLIYQGAVGDATMRVLYGIAGVVIVIIVVSSVFVIRNSFSISVSEKTKQYGMLTSIGATKKQIRKTVLLEGATIGVIAIPLGIICGIIAIIVLLWIVNILLGDMINGFTFTYSVPIIPILLSVLISGVTIYLSCIIPAIKAGRISPIEAIRGNEDIKIKAKKIKTSKLTKKLFGIGGVIASKNLKRNKKKFRTTVISLVVSVAIFISLSSFLEYGKKITTSYYMDIGYNIQVYGGTEDLYKEIAKLDNIDKYSYSYTKSFDIDKKYVSEYYKEVTGKHSSTETSPYITVTFINKEAFKEYVKQLGMNEKDYKNIAILGDDEISYNSDGSKKVERYYTLKTGDKITLKIEDSLNKEIQISKVTDIRPLGYEYTYSTGGFLFVSEDFLGKIPEDAHISSMPIKSKDATKTENMLIDLKANNNDYNEISVTNFETYVKQQSNMILLISIFLYGFIAVITLIGVTNIFNTITTNMILRSKEFANLKSIGMTSKEFNKMIRLESILYGLKSLIIGIPIGLVGSYAIYQSFANSTDFGYMLPWQSILISIVFVFIIVGLTMKYSLSKINKQNIIETIRRDNI